MTPTIPSIDDLDGVVGDRAFITGLVLVVAFWIQLWITTQIPGYELQVISALVTIGVALAAIVMFYRSLVGRDGIDGEDSC